MLPGRHGRGLPVALLVTVFSVLVPLRLLAHERSVSYSSWTLEGSTAHVRVRLWELDVSRFPWASTAGRHRDRILAEYLPSRLLLLADGVPCPLSRPARALQTIPGHIVFEWEYRCPARSARSIRSELFREVAPSHLHFARVRTGTHPAVEHLLSASAPELLLPEPAASPAGTAAAAPSLFDYGRLGFAHILSGPDHLVFVAALLLVGSSVGELARVVTGFTIAHSVTLALTAAGWLRTDRHAVDALIGLSIALVAVENVWLVAPAGSALPHMVAAILVACGAAAGFGFGAVPTMCLLGLALFAWCYLQLLTRVHTPLTLRWAIAFLFGLVHGVGFAGVLVEADLSGERLLRALFGFNLGVEVGQLAIIAVLWPIVRFARREGGASIHRLVVEIGSAAILAVGTYWFVIRNYG